MIANLQQIFNTFRTGVLVETAERTVQMVNQQFLDIFSIPVPADEMTGFDCKQAAEQVKELFKDPELFVADIIEIIADGKEHKSEVAFADGRYFIRKYSPIYNADGELCCHVWEYEDITTLKRKEEELLEQKEFFHKILNELPADIAIFSKGHRYMYLNKTAVKNEDVRQWMIGKDDYEYCEAKGLDTSIADARRAKFNEAKETRKSVSWVDELQTKEGKTNYVLRIFYPYINHSNEIEFVIGYGVNINKQKESEQIIAKQKERFSSLVNTLNDGVFQMTFGGNIQFYNSSFLKMMQLGDRNIHGQYQREVMRHVYADDKKHLYLAFNKLQETHEPQTGTFRVLDAKGKTSFIEYYIWYRHTQTDGHIAAGRLTDVTEREQQAHNMQRLIDKEKELNNLKSHFIHITSHELRTPLSVIMSSAEILEMVQAEGSIDMVDTAGMTTGIVKEVNRITSILDELLMIGRIENGRIKFAPSFVPLHSYIDEIAKDHFMPYTDGRGLHIDIQEGIEEVFIDTSLMRHAINNLVSNAFKYSPMAEAPELSIYIENKELHFAVRDHGIGIPQHELDNLFNSFYRASNVGNISGTGIGLMVVEHVVKTHNGRITVASKQGEGSVFTMSVPLKTNRR